MIRVLVVILTLLVMPALCAAEKVSITVTGPSQQIVVQPQSTVVTPEAVTVNAIISVTGTEITTIAVPGPQGIPGPKGADSTVPGPTGPPGATGPAGPAGTDGIIETQISILDKLAISTDGAVMVLTQGPTEADSAPKLQIKLRDGTVTTQLNADGTAFFAGGLITIKGSQ